MGNGYSIKENPALNDLALLWDSASSDWRRATLQSILDLFENSSTEDFTFMQEPITQYSAPVASGFDVQINDDNNDTHLILTPATALAVGSITLPEYTNVRNRQRVIVNTTKQLTAFSVNANGAAAVYGAPSAMGADDFFTLKYDNVVNSWYRIG